MAYTPGNLINTTGLPPGRNTYRYNTTDTVQTVEAAGYFNNTDDTLKLAAGDLIFVVTWSTAVDTGTIFDVSLVVVSTVDSNGVVNTSADILQKGIFSSTS